jgi:hypothetical protein
MVYVTEVLLTACEQDQERTSLVLLLLQQNQTSQQSAVSRPVWHKPLLRVQWKTPDDGQRHCPKHVEFYSKNKFEKLAHLVGFIIRIYHDARSPERQKPVWFIGGNVKWKFVIIQLFHTAWNKMPYERLERIWCGQTCSVPQKSTVQTTKCYSKRNESTVVTEHFALRWNTLNCLPHAALLFLTEINIWVL